MTIFTNAENRACKRFLTVLMSCLLLAGCSETPKPELAHIILEQDEALILSPEDAGLPKDTEFYADTRHVKPEPGNYEVPVFYVLEGKEFKDTLNLSIKPRIEEEQEEPQLEAVTASGPVVETPVEGGPVYINGIALVNKKHGLSPDYAPGEDPEAGAAFRQLVADMQSLGYDISNDYSGYRSWQTQSDLYNSYVAQSGQEQADTFSARPGFSEHQTGLAFDLKHGNGALVEKPAEAAWLEENAWQYGFIIRYRVGQEAITGYMAEPWHIRYVGERAQAIKESGLSLEEFLGLPGGDYE